jgi:predicted negative regulator of RcsB-dependent stress response
MSRRAFDSAKASPALGPEHVYTLSYMHNLAVVLQQEKKFDEAGKLLDECLMLRRRVEGAEAIPTYVTLNQIALLRMDEGKPGEALATLIEVRDGLAKKLPPTHWMHGVSRTCIGECLMEMKRTDEAEATLKQAYEMLVESQGAEAVRTRRPAGDLAKLYEEKGNVGEAAAWRAKAGG